MAKKTRQRVAMPTPGDWTFSDCDLTHKIFITPVDDPCLYIAELWTSANDPDGRYPTKKRQLANARLMAAAPKLLRACQQVVANWDKNLTAAAQACAEAVRDATGRA